MLCRNQRFVAAKHVIGVGAGKHRDRHAEPRIVFLRVPAERKQTGERGAQHAANLGVVTVVVA